MATNEKAIASLLRQIQSAGLVRTYYTSIFDIDPSRMDAENVNVKCCFHLDGNPSLSLNLKTGQYHCFGCGEKGSIIKFRMRYEKLTLAPVRQKFEKELKSMQDDNLALQSANPDEVRDPRRAKATIEEVKRWHTNLLDEPKFKPQLEILHKRGLKDDKIRQFQLGADVDVFDGGNASGACIVIPIFDGDGVTPLTVKKILYREGKHKLVISDGSTKVLFNANALLMNPGRDVFITEGELDAMRLSQEGLIVVSTAGGSECWGDTWAEHFKGRNVFVVYDSDKAGRSGARKVIDALKSVALSIKNIDLFGDNATAKQKDITDFFLAGKTLQDFKVIVDSAPNEFIGGEEDYKLPLTELLKKHGRHQSNEAQGIVIAHWIERNGGRFFRDGHDNEFILVGGTMLRIDEEDKRFCSYLFDKSNITTATVRGKVVVKALQAIAEKTGELIEDHTFLRLDIRARRLYINLHNEQNELVEITPDTVQVIPNGVNEQKIYVSRSDTMNAVEYTPLDEAGLKSALTFMDEVVAGNCACQGEDRLLFLAWVCCCAFAEATKTKPLMRLEGDSDSGKSTAMAIMSSMLYGYDCRAKSTTPALYSKGSRDPIQFEDNVELRNMNSELYDLLLTSSTGIRKNKREQGTNRGVVTESVKSLVCSNGIESLPGWELINRTYMIKFDRTEYGTVFTDEVFGGITDQRNKLLSALFQVYSKMLRSIAGGHWSMYQTMLRTKFKEHSKERTNGYMALMLLFVEEYYRVLGREFSAEAVAKMWIGVQERASTETTVDSDLLVQYLTHLRHVCVPIKEDDTWEYPMRRPILEDGKLIMITFARDLHLTFQQMLKGLSPPYQFKNARQLGRRLSDSRRILAQAGWDVTELKREMGRAVWKLEYKFEYERLPPQRLKKWKKLMGMKGDEPFLQQPGDNGN